MASEGDRWALARECPSGDVGIRFTYDSNNGVQGYLVFNDGQNPEMALRILTPADIPQSAVVSVNGQAGIVVLYATDLQMSSSDSTTISQAINNKAPIESLAIPIVGNVASVNVAAGKFVFVKNSTISGITDGLYIAVNAISANTPLTAADLDNTDTVAGGLNALNSKIIIREYTIPSTTIPAHGAALLQEDSINGYIPISCSLKTGSRLVYASNPYETTESAYTDKVLVRLISINDASTTITGTYTILFIKI